jgi:exodeoxyribonuclease VII large subunit
LCKAPDIDVIVLTRGGGSFEDLMPFSDERLVRAVAACPVPVVSAVGHEQDTPLCDLAADARASTPSLAARMVVPDADELVERLDRARAGLARGARRTVERDGERLERIRERLRRAPGLVVQRDRERLQRTHERLRRAPALILERRAARLEHAAGKLRALAPQATLERGYAIVRSGETILRSAGGLEAGTRVDVELAEGGFGARVEDVGE